MFRLEGLISELHLLIPEANLLQRTGLLYKQRLERRCSDLEKAEVEVCASKSLHYYVMHIALLQLDVMVS